MKKLLFSSLLFSSLLFSSLLFSSLLCNSLKAQNVGINGSGATANPSALLDLDDAAGGNNKGLLIPRIPLIAINVATPVTSPATSLLVYNTASAGTGTNVVSAGYYYWDGIKWVRLQTTQDWALTGNAGTNPSINYLGTSDTQDLVIKTNNTERMRVLSTGNIGIGTTIPTASLHIVASATNTGFQLQDGTEAIGKVLVSDVNGKASWTLLPSSISVVGSFSQAINVSIPSTPWWSLGAVIIPSAGVWNVSVNCRLFEPTFVSGLNAWHMAITNTNLPPSGINLLSLESILGVESSGQTFGDCSRNITFYTNTPITVYIKINSFGATSQIQDLGVNYGYGVNSNYIIARKVAN